MLHLKTIEPRTFALLKELQQIKELQGFHLAGGTALALRYGHRISIDLDLFGKEDLDKQAIVEVLTRQFSTDFVYEERPASWALFCFIRDIKVDIVRYDHPMVAPLDIVEGVRLFSTEDIIAMKLNAVLGRGTRKDFFDIYELLQHYSMSDMIRFHQLKFPQQRLMISIPQAPTYFEDAEESPDPVVLNGQTWPAVKDLIRQKVDEFLR